MCRHRPPRNPEFTLVHVLRGHERGVRKTRPAGAVEVAALEGRTDQHRETVFRRRNCPYKVIDVGYSMFSGRGPDKSAMFSGGYQPRAVPEGRRTARAGSPRRSATRPAAIIAPCSI